MTSFEPIQAKTPSSRLRWFWRRRVPSHVWSRHSVVSFVPCGPRTSCIIETHQANPRPWCPSRAPSTPSPPHRWWCSQWRSRPFTGPPMKIHTFTKLQNDITDNHTISIQDSMVTFDPSHPQRRQLLQPRREILTETMPPKFTLKIRCEVFDDSPRPRGHKLNWFTPSLDDPKCMV